MTPLTPSLALLAQCARLRLDQPAAERVRRLVEAGPDWPRVLQLAELHGLRPLLYHHLTTVCPADVPASVIEPLRRWVHFNTARNLSRARELLRLLAMFEAEGIHAVSYKGPLLAAELYGSLALREFADLDILVRRDDAARARTLLTADNYQPDLQLMARDDAAFRREYCEYTFRHAASGTIVEIQWDIAPRFFSVTLDRAGMESRIGTAAILGVPTRTLSPEDLLFILCVHGCKHAWEKLEWVCGVAELIRAHPQLNWTLVFDVAARAGARRMLLLGLVLARDVLDATLPAAAARAAGDDPAVTRLSAEMRARFRENAVADGAADRVLVHLRMRERRADRIRYCLRLASTPSARDWALLSALPASRTLTYPVRITRLALKYAALALASSGRQRPS